MSPGAAPDPVSTRPSLPDGAPAACAPSARPTPSSAPRGAGPGGRRANCSRSPGCGRVRSPGVGACGRAPSSASSKGSCGRSPGPGPRPLRVLDPGAGNGWLCYRVAGWVTRSRWTSAPTPWMAWALPQGMTPSCPGYSRAWPHPSSPAAPRPQLRHRGLQRLIALRDRAIGRLLKRSVCLPPMGPIAMLDSPFYAGNGDGEAMVAEQRRTARARFGGRPETSPPSASSSTSQPSAWPTRRRDTARLAAPSSELSARLRAATAPGAPLGPSAAITLRPLGGRGTMIRVPL